MTTELWTNLGWFPNTPGRGVDLGCTARTFPYSCVQYLGDWYKQSPNTFTLWCDVMRLFLFSVVVFSNSWLLLDCHGHEGNFTISNRRVDSCQWTVHKRSWLKNWYAIPANLFPLVFWWPCSELFVSGFCLGFGASATFFCSKAIVCFFMNPVSYFTSWNWHGLFWELSLTPWLLVNLVRDVHHPQISTYCSLISLIFVPLLHPMLLAHLGLVVHRGIAAGMTT